MRKKYLLSLSIALCLALAACGNSEESKTEKPAAVQEEAVITDVASDDKASAGDKSIEEKADTEENSAKDSAKEDSGNDSEQGEAVKSEDENADGGVADGEDTDPAKNETVKPTYDISEVHDAYVLSDGDALIGGTYVAAGEDESVLFADGDVSASVSGSYINKADGGASSADDSSFKGLNAAIRACGNAVLDLKDVTVEASAENATGVFAYEDSTINISDSVINVSGGGAGGVQVAGGGTLYGKNLTVTSASKAAIRSDRGGGTLVIYGGTYVSLGSNGCPAIYSTADITVSNADCRSENSRAVIIEGKNSVTLNNTTLSGNDQSTKEGSVKAGLLLYQSTSGDAKEGTSVFTMTGGSLETKTGALFYCTNTSSVINLNNVSLTPSEDNSLLIVSEGRWGKDGRNGGNAVFNAENQTLAGSIYVDSISSLELNLNGSTYTGHINSEGDTKMTLTSGSKWILDGDSTISSFEGSMDDVDLNGYSLNILN